MHHTVIDRLKSLLRAVGTLSSKLGGGRSKTKARINKRPIVRILPTSIPSHFPFYDEHSDPNLLATVQAVKAEPIKIPRSGQAEIYLPAHVWDALNPSERYASVIDLCAHLGDQLPIQVVKLIARDVLRGLESLQSVAPGCSHGDISPNNILLSPTDLRALISQLRAETQPSLRPSEISVGISFSREGFPSPDMTAVFTLSDITPEENNIRPEYPNRQALKPPEEILGVPSQGRTNAADMWSLGCVLFELLTGEALFDPQFQTIELDISKEESHFLQIIELFGEIPVDLVRSGCLSKQWFTVDGALRLDTSYYPIALGSVLAKHLKETEVLGTTAFLEKLLKLCPEERVRPQDIINDPWFTN